MSKAVMVTNIIHLRKERDGDTSMAVFVYTFRCVQKLHVDGEGEAMY
jgi:hypothetical protein